MSMADEDPSVFDTSWDNWNYPRRAIAAIAISAITITIVFRYSLQTLLNQGLHPILIVACVGISILVIGGGAAAILARFD